MIKLTEAQVREVVHWAGNCDVASDVLMAVQGPDWVLAPGVDGEKHRLMGQAVSRSLLTGLRVLSCLPRDGGSVGIGEVSRLPGMTVSTTHRYMRTLLAVGPAERDTDSRKYRIARIG